MLRFYIEKDVDEYIKDFYFSGSIDVSYKSFRTGKPSIGTSISSFFTNARFTMLTLADDPSWYLRNISCVVNSLCTPSMMARKKFIW